MKNIFKLSALTLLFISTVACTNTDDDITIMTPSEKPELLTPADGTVFVLDKTKATDMATTIVWDYAKYEGSQTVINYEVEMAKAGTDFKQVTVIAVTTDRLKVLTVGELNAAALNTGLKPFEAQDADIRVKSSIGSGGIPQYSNVVKVKITPYPAWDNWGIIGSATPGGWDNDTNLDYDLSTKKYSYVGALTVGEIKFRLDDSWTTNYGDDGNNLTLEAGGSNIPIPTAGNYTIVIDFNAKTYTIAKN